MRKIVVLLLLVGLMMGTFTTALGLEEVNFNEETSSLSGEDFTDTIGDPLPCGGEGSGGGGGQPG